MVPHSFHIQGDGFPAVFHSPGEQTALLNPHLLLGADPPEVFCTPGHLRHGPAVLRAFITSGEKYRAESFFQINSARPSVPLMSP